MRIFKILKKRKRTQSNKKETHYFFIISGHYEKVTCKFKKASFSDTVTYP